MLNYHHIYMHRCLQLAQLAKGNVAPNPMVGAVLVYNNVVIGEGYHQQFGQPHAEVNCINNVAEKYKHLIAQSTLYVSLEPCNHFGKTPPCVDAIIAHNIKKVVIGCTDIFSQVNGKGIDRLKFAAIDVITNILKNECIELNKRFFYFHQKKQPYIILKWAQTANNIIGNNNNERLLISNSIVNKLVHIWRSHEAAIMVGSNTVIKDNPQLTNRNGVGKNPIRLVVDRNLRIPIKSTVLSDDNKTIVFTFIQKKQANNATYIQLNKQENVLQQIMRYAYNNNIQSILIEGGKQLLQLFIDANLWNEARVITNTQMAVNNGIFAPQLTNAIIQKIETYNNNIIQYYTHQC